jgi:hypothetical protein
MTATKGIEFEGRFFWAYDVAAGVFLKHLIDVLMRLRQANRQMNRGCRRLCLLGVCKLR